MKTTIDHEADTAPEVKLNYEWKNFVKNL